MRVRRGAVPVLMELWQVRLCGDEDLADMSGVLECAGCSGERFTIERVALT